jgi:hypothetical protein
MKPLLRTLGVAVLAAALLNASAGLCFCHRGPVAPGADPASAACCHGPQAAAGTTLERPASCCDIESADSSATPAAAVHLAAPSTVSLAVTDARPSAEVLPVAAAAASFASPPILALRI